MELKTIITNASQQGDTDVFFSEHIAKLHRHLFLISLVSDDYYNMAKEVCEL
jgi:hypothetical protein